MAVGVTALGNAIANTVMAAINASIVTAVGDTTIAAIDHAPSILPDWMLSSEKEDELDAALEGTPVDLSAGILAIMVSVAGSGTVAVSAAVSGNVITNTVTAKVDGSTVRAGGDVVVSAVSDSGIVAITVGVGAAGTVGVQATCFGNVIVNRADALIQGNSKVVAGGLVDVSAIGSSTVSSIAVSVAASGSVAVSAIVGANVITDTLNAAITDSEVTSGTTLDVDAESRATVYAFGTGVGASGVVAIQALIAANVIVDRTSATITNSTIDAGGAIGVTAYNKSSIDALVVGVAVSGTVAVTVPLVVNDITNTTEAALTGSHVTGDSSLAMAAESSNVIRAISVGVSASGTVAVSVSGLGNVIHNTLTCLVTGSAVVVAGNVSLLAKDVCPSFIPEWMLPADKKEELNTALEDSPIDLDCNILAVMVSIAGSGTVAVSGTVSGNVIINSITADIVNSQVVSTSGSVSLYSSTDSGIIALTVGVGASGAVSVAVSGFGNVITNTVEAMVKQGSTVGAATFVSLTALDESIIRSVAVSISASGCVAVSAIVGANVIVGTITAGIADSSLSCGTTLDITSQTTSTVYAFATGVGASGVVAVQALIGANVIVDTTSAVILNSTVYAGGAVTLTAEDTSEIDALVVGVAASGTAAIEVPIVVNDITNATGAAITNSNLTSGSALTLKAESSNVIRALSVGVSASGCVSVTIAGLGNVIHNTLTSLITGSTIRAAGRVALSAKDVAPGLLPEWMLPDDKKEQVNTALEDSPIDLDCNILAVMVSISGSGTVAVSGTASGNVIINTITADIVSSRVNSGPLGLEASTDSGIIALTVGVGASGAVSVSVSLFGNVITNTVEAMVKQSSTIVATGAASLSALDESFIRSASVSVAASGGVSVSAIVGANVITGTVTAGITDSSLTSGGALDVSAETKSIVYAFATGVGASGIVAVQALIGANVIVDTTSAVITNSTVHAAGAVSITAKDTSTIDALVVGVAASGVVAVEVPIVVNDITNTTEAKVTNSTLSTSSSLALLAESRNVIRAISVGVSASGTVAVSVAGLGNAITNTLTAKIGGSTITAASGVSVTAHDVTPTAIPEWILPDDKKEQVNDAVEDSPFDLDTNILAILASISGSGGVAVAGVVSGNVIVNTIRADIVNSHVTAGGLVDLAASTESGIIALSVGVGGAKWVAIAATGFGNVITGTIAATIDTGSVINTTGGVDLSALDESHISSAALSIAGSGGVAVSFIIGANVITNTTTAKIAGSTVTAGGALSVDAETDSAIYSFAGGIAFATGAGAATLAANVVTDTTDALVQTSTVAAASAAIHASNAATIQSAAGEVAVGVTGGLGAGVAYNLITNIIRARMLSGSLTASAGSVSVTAVGSGTIEVVSAGGAGGILVGVAGTVTIQTISNTIEAVIDTCTVYAIDTVLVLGRWDGEISADGGTGAVGGLVGLGGTIVTNTLTNNVTSRIEHSVATGHGLAQA